MPNMSSNGNIPRSQLGRIPGNGWLRKDAAAAYTAMHKESMRRFGVSMALYEGSIRRTYRPLSAQWLAWNTLPRGQAAYPGTSNHGWGLAVDLMSYAQRRVVDQIGAKYGFSKSWSDAQHEWWHIRYRPGVWNGRVEKPSPFHVLTSREKKLVRKLKYHRAGMRKEERSGRGSKWYKHLKWARYWKAKIRRQMQRLQADGRKSGWDKDNRGQRYQVLAKVYKGEI